MATLSMQMITVYLDPANPEMLLTVEAPEGSATISWVKDELCRQDPTGMTRPENFCLCAVEAPDSALEDSLAIAAATRSLLLKPAAAEAPASAAEEEVQERVEFEQCRQRERHDIERAAEMKARGAAEFRAKAALSLPRAVRLHWQKMWDQGSVSEYTFDLEDQRWVKYLKRQGFCVLRDVLPANDFQQVEEQFWSEIAFVVPGLRREDPLTWHFPGQESHGIARGYGLPNSNFAWAVRTHPRVKRAFELIFRTDQLAVSVDSVKLMGTGVGEPGPFWLHRDQLKDVAAYSVQSIFAFYEVGPLNDGTILVPGSHRASYPWDEWQRSARGVPRPMLRAHGRERNNVRVPEELQEAFMAQAVKPRVPGNGLVLFSSRTIHASSPDPGARWLREREAPAAPPRPRPNRVAVSVAMCPRARRSLQTLVYKMTLLKSRCSTTHWPDDEVARGRVWGRDEAWAGGDGFRVLPPPSLESESKRMELL